MKQRFTDGKAVRQGLIRDEVKQSIEVRLNNLSVDKSKVHDRRKDRKAIEDLCPQVEDETLNRL